MRYSHSSVWLISWCPILAWLLSAQFVFLHCKSTFPQVEFSSVHDVLIPVSRAQHFTHQPLLAQRSPRSSQARQGAEAWRSQAPTVLQSLGWLLTFAIAYFGSDHFGSSPLMLSQDNPPLCSTLSALAPVLFWIVRNRQRHVHGGYQLLIAHFCSYAVLASPSEIIVSLGLTWWVPAPPESLLLHSKYINLI